MTLQGIHPYAMALEWLLKAKAQGLPEAISRYLLFRAWPAGTFRHTVRSASSAGVA